MRRFRGPTGGVGGAAAAVLGLFVFTACSAATRGTGHSSAQPSTGFPSSPTAPSAPQTVTVTATPSSAGPSTTTGALPSLAHVREQLAPAVAPERAGAVVGVPGGYEAIAFDSRGHTTFWSWRPSGWTQVGRSSYPAGAEGFGSPYPTSVATVLDRMAHATFILRGEFSGDGTANAAAYTTGGSGWGVVKAESDGNIGPSGDGVTYGGIGLEEDDRFVAGQLETIECSSRYIVADCGGTTTNRKFWRWAGHDFHLVRSLPASPPTSH